MKFVLLVAMLLSANAMASKLYQITGEVVGVTEHTVSIRRGSETFQFKRAKHLGLPKNGDRITVRYHLDAEQISPASQGAGTAPDQPDLQDGPVPPGAAGVPGIIDDRAFYNAKNKVHSTHRNPS